MVEGVHIRLALSNRPHNVAIVRQALAGLADATGLSRGDLNDIATAVTEACNNVCVHAYGGDEGPLEVELHSMQAAMVATVRDRGVGLALDARALPEFPIDVDGELAGIGLPSIQALASEVRWSETSGGGVSVQMTFATDTPASGGWVNPECDLAASPFAQPCELGPTIEVAMAPLEVAREVLIRLLHATAARARFSIDRHAEVQRVGAALLADPENWTSSGGIHARLIADTDSLELAIGPIARDRAKLLAQTAARGKPRLRGSIGPADDHRHTLVVRLRP